MDKEQIHKRFGMIAVEKGFVTEDHVIEALVIQATENYRMGRHRFIGKILLENGLLTSTQLFEVLEALSQRDGE